MSSSSQHRYDPSTIEKKWQRVWERDGLHRAPDEPEGNKYYCLDMFPYPSGSGLHVGHWRGYVLSDVIARYHRLLGEVVLHPMGWDAFGLPAENDAIKKHTHPEQNTRRNIDNMRRQLGEIGAMYDWSREFATTDPDFYKWTQWIFLRMLDRGLAYRATVPINWCPSCRCGLANEEVVAGRCERCGGPTEIRDRTQWLLKITDYADRLLETLDELDWPEKIKTMQRNWIGKSYGTEIIFDLIGNDGQHHPLPVFTTRPDTLWGTSYVVLAPEHPLAEQISSPECLEGVRDYLASARCESEMDRTAAGRDPSGVPTGATAVNPATGEAVPVWVSDYVLMHYGSGAVMGVPAHDDRDWRFAQEFCLPIIPVVEPLKDGAQSGHVPIGAFAGRGRLVNSGDFSGLESCEASERITEWLSSRGVGSAKTNYRLRDWVFSRQRYWGEPIPVVYCDTCGSVPVPDDQLPVLLPSVENYEVTGTGDSPLAGISAWVNTTCPKCGGPARRETDTMPQWAGSSWYFLRFASPHYEEGPFDHRAVERWLPVDMYVGGVEHAILHLLYARFFVKVLHDEGLIEFDEPFKRLFNQGMVSRQSYRCDTCRTWVAEENAVDGSQCPTCGEALLIKMDKMSKSKSNSVSPDDLVRSYGADAVRMYELFMGAPELDAEWIDTGISGCERFLRRFYAWVWRCTDAHVSGLDSQKVLKARHELIRTVSERIESLRLNTAVSAHMEFLNKVEREDPVDIGPETIEQAIVCLAPFAPHLAEELWREARGYAGSVFKADWPAWDAKVLAVETVEIPVQVDSKVVARIQVGVGVPQTEVEAAAVSNPAVQKYIEGRRVVRVIVVSNKIVSIVTAQ